MTIPQLAPFAAVAGATLQGHTTLDLSGGMQDGTTQLAVTGTIGLDSGTPPAPALLGNDARIDLLASMRGQDLTITRFALNGKEATASVTGHASPSSVDLDWSMALSDLAAVQPSPAGQTGGAGPCRRQFAGPFADGGHERRGGDARTSAAGALSAHLQAQGLPGAPSGQLTAQGALLGVTDRAGCGRTAPAETGDAHRTIDRADWKSAHAEGAVTLTPPNIVPEGRLTFAMTRLADLAPAGRQPDRRQRGGDAGLHAGGGKARGERA